MILGLVPAMEFKYNLLLMILHIMMKKWSTARGRNQICNLLLCYAQRNMTVASIEGHNLYPIVCKE